MNALLSPHALLIAGAIFCLRLISWASDTIRLLFIINNRKALVWLLGVIGSLAFLVPFTLVMSDPGNLLFILSYIFGSATGSSVGMALEERMALGFIHLNIISPSLGKTLADRLRSEGFGVTEIPALGRGGMVTNLRCYTLRKQVGDVEAIARETDPMAFIIASEVRPIRKGFWRLLV